jgi:hypothetical protein
MERLVDQWDQEFAAFRAQFHALSCFTNRQVVELVLQLARERLPQAWELLSLPEGSNTATHNISELECLKFHFFKNFLSSQSEFEYPIVFVYFVVFRD